jgi:ribonucleotide reductase alpha subunit
LIINKLIFETIYHASVERSNEMAKDRMVGMNILSSRSFYGDNKLPSLFTDSSSRTCRTYIQRENDNEDECKYRNKLLQTLLPTPPEFNMLKGDRAGSYSSFEGCPASKGILQFDMWGVTPSSRYDWDSLKKSVVQYGLRNSLLVAPMPTASTSQILGNNECFEPITSNIYTRRTLAGEFIIVNRYLIRELIQLGLWNERIKTNIIANNGSVQYIEGLSEHIKQKYKIVWEMPMKHIIDMAADRGAFICQSQSMNLWVEEPNYNILTSMLFYAWNKGLKTGVYYLRRKAKHQPQQFTIEPEKKGTGDDEHEICEFCSS